MDKFFTAPSSQYTEETCWWPSRQNPFLRLHLHHTVTVTSSQRAVFHAVLKNLFPCTLSPDGFYVYTWHLKKNKTAEQWSLSPLVHHSLRCGCSLALRAAPGSRRDLRYSLSIRGRTLNTSVRWLDRKQHVRRITSGRRPTALSGG